MYICRVIGKEAVSASPQGLLKGRLEGLQKRLAGASKMLGRAQEAGRHEARVTGGRLAKLAGGWRKYAPEMLFAEQEGSGGLYGSGGSLKLFLEGAFGLGGLYGSFWGLWGSAGFVRAQGLRLSGSPFLSPIYYNKQLRIMKNRKIIFANQKGGVGKSTLCILFANYLAWKKQDVCVIDTDLQKTIKMQRRKDMELYEGQEEPYVVQDFDVQDPETMQQLMDSASNTEGYVLFDSPGNVSEDGLVPMFTNADFIVCPYEYEEKTLDSTGTFVQVINALRQHTPEMTAKLFFVPNRIDVRIGTKNELDMWKQTDAIFKQLGAVTPRITARAALKRINTVEITAAQREAVKPAFDFMIRRMKE